jgi:holo-[acyl-carrier protein] synthase
MDGMVGEKVRVGADLTKVSDVEESMARFGRRYLERVYTEHELSSCQGPAPAMAARLAARFAAKEAVIKVLRPPGANPTWRSMEVVRHPEGWCELRLQGTAAELADEAGIKDMAVSLTHEGSYAGAVVVALCAQGGTSR